MSTLEKLRPAAIWTKARRLLSFVGKFVKDASGSGESLQDRSASHQFAWRVEDDEVAGLQSAHQSLLTVAQLAEAALNGTEHVVVACDPNPMAFVCHLCECQFEPPSRLKNLLLAFAKHHGAEIVVDRIKPGRQRRGCLHVRLNAGQLAHGRIVFL